MLRECWSDDGVVGEMSEIGKDLVGELDRCRKREKNRCHRIIAVVIGLRKCPPATQTMSFLRKQPSRKRHGWSVMEPPRTSTMYLGDRHTLKPCLLSRSNDDKMENMIIMINSNVFLINQHHQ